MPTPAYPIPASSAMPEYQTLPLVSLLLDTRNARLRDEQASQQSAILSLARQQGRRLLKIAADIVERGTDPIALIAVVPTPDGKRYTVIEGNRRVAALRALETPALVSAAYDAAAQREWNRLANRFAQKPIERLTCAVFQSEAEIAHWVTIRHTGQNQGVGLVEWGSDEQDRWKARHDDSSRSPAGQIIDFVERSGLLSDAATNSQKGIISNLRRAINSREIKERLGIAVVNGIVMSYYPGTEVAKGLAYIVEGFRIGDITVKDIYHAPDRVKFAKKIPTEALPDSATKLPAPKALGDLDFSAPKSPKGKPKNKPPRPPKDPPERDTLVPDSCRLSIPQRRILQVYNELRTLSLASYPNAASVLLRVFVELSVDYYISQSKLMSEATRRNTPLAKRLKAVAADMVTKGKIDSQLETAVNKIADGQHVIAASMVNFNQYVHNQWVFPRASELKTAWDELEPFLEKLWP